MSYSKETALIWQAMGIGPLWIERDAEDPLSPSAVLAEKLQSAAQVALEEKTAVARPQKPEVATPAPIKPVASEPVWGEMPKMSVAPAQKPVQPKPVQAPVRPAARPVASRDTTLEVPIHDDKPIAAGVVELDHAILSKIPEASWGELREVVRGCTMCESLAQSRLSTVFGTAKPGASIAIVGEAPGRDEDLKGEPFVGKSGELLENILRECGWKRGDDVAIINVLKCRPQNNRNPHENEMKACRAFLDRQLSLLGPKIVILLGRYATMSLLETQASIGSLRGKEHAIEINGRQVPTFVTYHPSYLLRSPSEKLSAWRDFSLARTAWMK
jgi:DNA polymerase